MFAISLATSEDIDHGLVDRGRRGTRGEGPSCGGVGGSELLCRLREWNQSQLVVVSPDQLAHREGHIRERLQREIPSDHHAAVFEGEVVAVVLLDGDVLQACAIAS